MKKIAIFIIGISFLFTGCNDFFELDYPITPPVTTVEDLERATAGAYYYMSGLSGNVGVPDNLTVYASCVSDEVRAVPGGANVPEAFTLYERITGADNTLLNNMYNPAYGMIGGANKWLHEISTGIFDRQERAELLPRIKGEFHFIRAYAYFSLVRTYCPPYEKDGANDMKKLPFITQPIAGLSEAFPEVGSVQQIYDQIVDDLKNAKTLLTDVPGHPGHAGKFAAHALLARVYFQMGEFELAKQECDIVIDHNNGLYDLSQEPITAWEKGWDCKDAKEVIWHFAQGNTTYMNGLGDKSSDWNVLRRFMVFNFANSASGSLKVHDHRCMAISYSLLKKAGWVNMSDTTATLEALNDKRFKQVYAYNAGADPYVIGISGKFFWVNKYYRTSLEESATGKGIGAVPLIRLAEMYLTRSITRFMAGDKTGAAADLDVIRKRAWAGEGEYTPVNPAMLTAEDIHIERWKELAGEADRLFYLQALKINIPNGDRDGSEISYKADNLRWKLPQREYELNPNLDPDVN
ncbi:MAG: RagB/SusD family nutrient uptake outer membrane protein [Tannerella sp.]|jgi:hypothetical protein|nr:RagB/SusD family nutrient uptake outer membrane protein [Tannerella sp.]